MKTQQQFKHIVGEAKAGEPAIIRFFGSVTESNVQCFNSEFLWIQDVVKPSKIIVLINSDGGSVVQGMSTFSIIQSCPIEVDCVIEGLAASMGSVIWAAGDNLYMHDYSILMIHNPFVGYGEMDENTTAMVNAFKLQLATIYQKRFGLPKDKVQEIMDGAENVDGTYLTAKDAVKAGILSADHIIKTSKQTTSKVKNEIGNSRDVNEIYSYMCDIAAEVDESKLLRQCYAINNQNELQDKNEKVMNEREILASSIIAQLGMGAEADSGKVSAKITALLAAEQKLGDTEAKLNELQIKYSGKEAEVSNLQAKLNDVTAELQQYKDAEQKAHDQAVNAMIDEAIQSGKIQESAKESWISMAKNNFELAKQTLESIPARDVISQHIAEDPANKQDAASGKSETEREVEARVKSVVGDAFNFKRF